MIRWVFGELAVSAGWESYRSSARSGMAGRGQRQQRTQLRIGRGHRAFQPLACCWSSIQDVWLQCTVGFVDGCAHAEVQLYFNAVKAPAGAADCATIMLHCNLPGHRYLARKMVGTDTRYPQLLPGSIICFLKKALVHTGYTA
jgi:hypothetical protein